MGLTKIVFDKERKLLVDEDKLEFKGTRVSSIVSVTTPLTYSLGGIAAGEALDLLQIIGMREFAATAYEFVSANQFDESWKGEFELPIYRGTATGIFYKRD